MVSCVVVSSDWYFLVYFTKQFNLFLAKPPMNSNSGSAKFVLTALVK